MDNQTVTPQDAVKFYLKNSEHIDIVKMLQSFAISNPSAFTDFISEITGMKPTGIAAKLAGSLPEVFMQLATNAKERHAAGGTILRLMISKQKVPAIKEIRNNWKVGLKEAKDVSDVAQHKLYLAGANIEDYDIRHISSAKFLPEQNDAVRVILEAYRDEHGI